MITQNRTQARSKAPVSSHPLFPAIVALWFGALFGLGSLAVRPSLIESLVINSHLDVILPMTAPPLGMTARILLALGMAMIGIAAGAIIARRIARPKPVERQRRRNATSEVSKVNARVFAAPAAAPQPEAEAEAAVAGRRRDLTVEAVEPGLRADYRLNAAPLPGGSPAIFDVTQVDLDEPQAAHPEHAEAEEEPQPLELSSFAQPVSAPDTEEILPAVTDDDCLELDETAKSEIGETDMPSERQVFGQPQQTFGNPFGNDFAPETPTAPTGETALEPELAQARPFDAAPEDIAAASEPEPSLQSFAAPSAEPVALPAEENRAMEISAMHTELRRFVGQAPDDAAHSPAAVSPETETATSETPLPADGPALPAGLVLPQGSAAERIIGAPLAELSPVELIERFALALQQRRTSGGWPDSLVAAAAAFAPAATEPEPEPGAAPAAFAPPVAEPHCETAPEAGSAPEQPRLPAVYDVAALAGELADDAPAQAAPSPLALPAALRPIDFSEYEDLDEPTGDVPARSIAMPTADQSVAAVAHDETQVEAEGEAEADVLEESYSSLLDLNRPAPLRQTFVRVEEPLADSASVEPVVIFPGQDARAGMRFARPAEGSAPVQPSAEPAPVAADAAESGVTSLRRFDAPGAAPAAPAQDPAEAELALRSALATLQRMSGAA